MIIHNPNPNKFIGLGNLKVFITFIFFALCFMLLCFVVTTSL